MNERLTLMGLERSTSVFLRTECGQVRGTVIAQTLAEQSGPLVVSQRK